MPPPFLHMVGSVQYNTIVQYNTDAALCTIFTLQTSFKPLLEGGGGGSYELLYCSPLQSSFYQKIL
jgi:hypothetical protein